MTFYNHFVLVAGRASYSMAMLSGVQLRWVDVLLPPGDFSGPLEVPPSAVALAPDPKITPEPW